MECARRVSTHDGYSRPRNNISISIFNPAPSLRCRRKRNAHAPLARQNEVEATREAADMADRWQKTFLRTLRALHDLRRFASPIVIQNAGQVNVANQQVNVA